MTARAETIDAASIGRAERAASAGETAWLAAVPCALATVAAVALLGPPIGRALLAPPHVTEVAAGFRPEPVEHARYAIALLAPLALSAILALTRGRLTAGATIRQASIRIAEGLLLAFVVFAALAPRVLTYRGAIGRLYPQHRVYFTVATLAAAVAVAGALAAGLRSAAIVERFEAWARTRWLERAAVGVALVLVAAWMATAVDSEGTIGRAVWLRPDIAFWLDETFAVLNGAVPLVSFHAQYAQLWPYVTAGAMALLGTTVGVYAGVMVATTSAVMLAVFATFRRVAGSALAALSLFAPFLATSFFREEGSLTSRYGPANLFSLFPIRYGGPYLLAWLIARRLGGARPRSVVLLGFVAGLVVLNNAEFGTPALAATLAALAWTLPRPGWRALARLLGATALGLAGAVAAVATLTLSTAGALPHLGLLFEYARLYGVLGFGMLPMPTVGFHLAIYVTFAAALVLATVRAQTRERDVVLTGMLAWSGVFGLGVGGYYAGRSHPDVLIDVFSPWAFALMLLLVACVRAIRARRSRRPTLGELAVLLGFGLAVCSIAQTPMPWSQAERLRATTATPAYRPLAAERFVRRHTRPGERVLLLPDLGHRIAYDTGVVDVFPYPSVFATATLEQWQLVMRIIDRQRIRAVFASTARSTSLIGSFEAMGFRLEAADRRVAQLALLTR